MNPATLAIGAPDSGLLPKIGFCEIENFEPMKYEMI
jgi:hypothetical protein